MLFFLLGASFLLAMDPPPKKIISDILNLEHIKTSEIAAIFPSMEPKDQNEIEYGLSIIAQHYISLRKF